MPARITFFDKLELVEITGGTVRVHGHSGQEVMAGVATRAEFRRYIEQAKIALDDWEESQGECQIITGRFG